MLPYILAYKLIFLVCLFVLVITSKPNRVCVSLSMCVSVCVTAGEEIDNDIHYALADTMSLNDWVNFFLNDDNDSDFEGF